MYNEVKLKKTILLASRSVVLWICFCYCFRFASDIDQTNTYRDISHLTRLLRFLTRDIRDGNWLSRAEQADGVEVAWGADRTDVAVKYIL